jgi:hypothetical protein
MLFGFFWKIVLIEHIIIHIKTLWNKIFDFRKASLLMVISGDGDSGGVRVFVSEGVLACIVCVCACVCVCVCVCVCC